MILNYYLLLLDSEEEKDRFSQIYNTYRNLMYYVARRILHDDYLAEDAVHNSFLKIIRHLDKFKDLYCHKTKNFLVIIVENSAKDIYNKQKKSNVFLNSLEIDIPYDKNFEEDILNRIEASEIVKEIQLFPEIYRDVLMLRIIYDLSYKEISNILNISETTIRKRFERAKIKLYENLNKELMSK